MTRKTNIGHKLNEEQDLKIVKPMHKWITVLDKWQLECSFRPTIPRQQTIVERLQIDYKSTSRLHTILTTIQNEHNSKFSECTDRSIELNWMRAYLCFECDNKIFSQIIYVMLLLNRI